MFVAPQALHGGRKMLDEFVKHSDLVAFADASVNLKRNDAKEYREQVNRLRDKMEAFINENPDVGQIRRGQTWFSVFRPSLVSSNVMEDRQVQNRGDTPLLHSSCRMAESKLTTKAVKSRPARVDTAREATLSVPAHQYRD